MSSKDERVKAQETARGWHRLNPPPPPDAQEWQHDKRIRGQFK